MSNLGGPIREGDKVRLGRAGWRMTVLEFEGDGAYCVWQSDSGRHTAWFAISCLAKAEEPRPWMPALRSLWSRQPRPRIEQGTVI
jgi:uncharacterized protein YodC (DUF2158 family)